VTATLTELLMLVKCTTVSLSLKTNGELNTVQILNLSIVHLHSSVLNAQVLGLVTISMISLLKSLLSMTPTMMDLSISEITSNQNIYLS